MVVPLVSDFVAQYRMNLSIASFGLTAVVLVAYFGTKCLWRACRPAFREDAAADKYKDL